MGRSTAQIQHSLKLLTVNRRYNKVLVKLLKKTLTFLSKNKDILVINNYLESRTLDWFRYCDKFNPENKYSPNPNAYIDNLVRYVEKKKV